MSRRYLLGPVGEPFAASALRPQRQSGEVVVFGPGPTADLVLRWGDTWPDVRARLPSGWVPDGIVLCLPDLLVPRGLWSAPIPLVALADNWALFWHYYRRNLPRCELVLTPVDGVGPFTQQGIDQARPFPFIGGSETSLDDAWPALQEVMDRDGRQSWSMQPVVLRLRGATNCSLVAGN
jgi:hypothetical protein